MSFSCHFVKSHCRRNSTRSMVILFSDGCDSKARCVGDWLETIAYMRYWTLELWSLILDYTGMRANVKCTLGRNRY